MHLKKRLNRLFQVLDTITFDIDLSGIQLEAIYGPVGIRRQSFMTLSCSNPLKIFVVVHEIPGKSMFFSKYPA